MVKSYNPRQNKHLRCLTGPVSEICNPCIALSQQRHRLLGEHLPVNQLKKHLTKLKRVFKYVPAAGAGVDPVPELGR